jgi:hypothetical protein
MKGINTPGQALDSGGVASFSAPRDGVSHLAFPALSRERNLPADSFPLAPLVNEETVVKQRGMEYAVCMNNREWYTEAMRFCQLSKSCASCPYQLLSGGIDAPSSNDIPCFSSKEALLALDAWLSEEYAYSNDDVDMEEDDHQWLQDLLRVQFHEEESEEDTFFDDDLF